MLMKTGLIKVAILCTILVLTISLVGEASENLILEVTEGRGNRGGKVEILVRAKNAAGSEGGQFVLNYDPNLVAPASIQAGGLISAARDDIFMANLEFAPGQVMVMWVTVYGDTADSGIVCSLVFDLVKDGESALELSEVVIVADDVAATATLIPGKIRIGAATTRSTTTVTRPEERGPEEENGEERNGYEGEPVDSNDEKMDEETISGEMPLSEERTEDRFFLYAVIVAVFAIVLSIGFAIVKKLKKPGS